MLLAIFLVPACTSQPRDPKTVALVNDTPILQSELQKEVAQHLQQYADAKRTDSMVEDHLTELIERKLMIQEAVKAGLSEDEQFAETIKRFWEQTLIRNLIAAKSADLEKGLIATDEDMRKAYDRMHYEIVMRVVRVKDRAAAVKAEAALREGTPVVRMKLLGPLFFDDVKHTPMEHAFDLKQGESGVFAADTTFIALMVDQKKSIRLPPFDSLRESLKAAVLEYKREQAIADWLEGLRKASKITINKELVEGVAHAK
jgi:hypothetical protein